MVSIKTINKTPQQVTQSSQLSGRDSKTENVIADEFSNSGYTALRSVEIEFRDNVLTMKGIVYSFYVKQVAQETVKRLIPNCVVDNRITVVAGKPPAQQLDKDPAADA